VLDSLNFWTFLTVLGVTTLGVLVPWLSGSTHP